MSKVIVERPRGPRGPSVGSAYPRGTLENEWGPDLENSPRTEGMGTRYGTKYLRENLAPLGRFLRAQIGRLWDDVHSEMSAHISCSSAVQKHVLDHLRQDVEENVWLENGAPFSIDRIGRVLALTSTERWPTFYVCPQSRRLCAAPIAPRRARSVPPWRLPDPSVVTIDDEHHLKRIESIWYELTLAKIPRTASEAADCYDVLARTFVELSRTFGANPIWRTGRYVVKKLQLNSREIARHRLPRSS